MWKYWKVFLEIIVEVIILGIFDNFFLYELLEDCLVEFDKDGVFDIFMFGRVVFEDRKFKGFDIVVKVVVCFGFKFCLIFVGF